MLTNKINFTKQEKETCWKFTGAVYDTNKNEYARRGQGNEKKVKMQQLTGKLGEVAVAKFLGGTIDDVDTKVYAVAAKRWGTDVKGYHVKSIYKTGYQSSKSWVIEKSDRNLNTSGSQELIYLVQVYDWYALIVACLPVSVAVQISRPMLKAELTTKRAIYLSDVPDEYRIYQPQWTQEDMFSDAV